MLQSLSIRNIVLITKLDLDLTTGLCVLTGETGAGKSIILDALGLILGARANSKLIRHGCEQGTVTACFHLNKDVPELKAHLDEYGLLMDDNQLFIRRVLYSSGKSKAFVNDTPVNQTTLSALASHLVEIHGQHDQHSFMQPAAHREALDALGNLKSQREKTKEAFNNYHRYKTELAEIKQRADRAAQEEDYLRHIHQELTTLKPQEGEEETLAEQRSQLMQQDKMLSALHDTIEHLEGQHSVHQSLQAAQRALAKTPSNTTSESINELLEQAMVNSDEASQMLHQHLREISNCDLSIDEIEERLFTLRDAARKFRRTPDELVSYTNEVNEKLALIDNQQHSLDTLQQHMADAAKAYKHEAEQLHQARHAVAGELTSRVLEELTPLKMERSQFTVEITKTEEEQWSATGIDQVQFIASMNPGTPMGPIHKLASGGELSRFMLALKVVLADTKSLPVLIFDEVDTGIGGAVADAVGKRLATLAGHHQLLVITHQPQVAARASMHLKVSKEHKNEHTYTHVTILSDQERNEELARMLAGDIITDEARAAAKKLVTA